jgi:hypothetical protein
MQVLQRTGSADLIISHRWYLRVALQELVIECGNMLCKTSNFHIFSLRPGLAWPVPPLHNTCYVAAPDTDIEKGYLHMGSRHHT